MRYVNGDGSPNARTGRSQIQTMFPKCSGLAGRHEQILSWPLLAALGREEEARTAVAEALAKFPDLSIEGFAGGPDFNEADRLRLNETMGKANFPRCASEAVLKDRPNLIRLPECVQS